MASDFPCHVTQEFESGSAVQEYPVSVVAGETAAKSGELMFYDTTDNRLERCGADPAVIAGIFDAGNSDNARLLTPDNQVPMRNLTPNAVCRFASATTPTQAHVGDTYGITRAASGNWLLDTGKTGASARVLVARVDIPAGAFYVRFLAANLQFSTVVS